MIESKSVQRIISVLFLGTFGFLLYRTWDKAVMEGSYRRIPAAMAPVLALEGLGLIIVPIDGGKQKQRYGVAKPQDFNQLPVIWKVLAVFALIAGVGNWLALGWVIGGI
jgi:hypothetical protein